MSLNTQFSSTFCCLTVQLTLLTQCISTSTTPSPTMDRFEKISADPGCVLQTDSDVNGYYVSLGRCNNNFSTVYIQQNVTSYSEGESVYVLYYGSFTSDQSVDGHDEDDDTKITAYGFYWCPTRNDYSIDGENDDNNDNSAYCASPNDYGSGCSGSPKIYCAQEATPSSFDPDTNDGYYTFADYCHEWKIYDSSTEDSDAWVEFQPNTNCEKGGTIVTPGTSTPEPVGSTGEGGDPNQLSESLTNVWAVLGIVIGIILVLIGFFAMLKRGKYIWELRRAHRPVILPMGSLSGNKSETADNNNNNNNNNNNINHTNNNVNANLSRIKNKLVLLHRNMKNKAGKHVEIADLEEDDDEVDEELGAVIVGGNGTRKNIHANPNHAMLRHIPQQAAPPIPVGGINSNNNKNKNELITPRDGSTVNNKMLHETMINHSDDNSANTLGIQNRKLSVDSIDSSNSNNNNNNITTNDRTNKSKDTHTVGNGVSMHENTNQQDTTE